MINIDQLLGRWATYTGHIQRIPDRVLIASESPRPDGVVLIHWAGEKVPGDWVHISDLTIDPATLATFEEYLYAPEGTVIAGGDEVWIKNSNEEYVWSGTDGKDCPSIGITGTMLTVLRWGRGE